MRRNRVLRAAAVAMLSLGAFGTSALAAHAAVAPPTLPGGAVGAGGVGYAAVLEAMTTECVPLFGGSVSSPRWIATSNPTRATELVAELDGSTTDPIEIRDVSIPPVAQQPAAPKGSPAKEPKSAIPAVMMRGPHGARLRLGPIHVPIGVAVVATIHRWTASGWRPMATGDLAPLTDRAALPRCPPRWYDIDKADALPDPVVLAIPAAALPLFGPNPTVTLDARLPKLANGSYRIELTIHNTGLVYAPFRIV